MTSRSWRRVATSRLRDVPGLGAAAITAKRSVERLRFPGSEAYWERHYRAGGDSGPGSRGRLAAYKAGFVNDFVARHEVRSVLELGCGDGAQLALADYPAYTGLDVSATALRACVTRFADDPTKTFLPYAPGAFADPRGLLRADLAISLDVLFHLVELPVFETYLQDLFGLARRYVLIYASDGPRDSTIGSVTDRPFTDHVRATQPDWRPTERVPNPHAWNGDVATTTRSEFFVYERTAGELTS
jgi:SAM-dependent methyltransferase